MGPNNYHLNELNIAMSPGDPARIMPPIMRSDRTVLDVGCGAGQTIIASDIGPDTTIIGIDVDRSALLLGRQLDRTISLVCGRSESLPFQSEHFDFVFSRVALPYMHVQTTLAEIWRVLKVGGRVWLLLHPYSMILKETLGAFSRLKIKRVATCLYVIANGIALNLVGKEFHLPFRKHCYESFQTIRGIEDLLRKTGFNEINASRNEFFLATARKTHSLPTAVTKR